MGELADRRAGTANRIAALIAGLESVEELAKGKACVYATGSFGRGEASSHSDLDLFIVGKNRADEQKGSLLRPLDEICLKAELIGVTRRLGFPDFTDDGRYLTHYSVADFTKTLGTPEDDVTNTFTARLLLLLESRPLAETAVYDEVLRDVIAAYWRDYADHSRDFMPAFLANDILRLWRTFCVNYEARTTRVPDEKNERKAQELQTETQQTADVLFRSSLSPCSIRTEQDGEPSRSADDDSAYPDGTPRVALRPARA